MSRSTEPYNAFFGTNTLWQAGPVDGHILHACLLGFAQTLPNHRGAMADVSSKHVH